LSLVFLVFFCNINKKVSITIITIGWGIVMNYYKLRYFSILPVIFFILTLTWFNSHSQGSHLSPLEKNIHSQSTIYQCDGNYCFFIPLVQCNRPVPEIYPPCGRWPHASGQTLLISFRWGDRLQSPGSLWRIAFEDGSYSWNYTNTHIWYFLNPGADNIINLYDDESGN
jgi:hypothetical protein